MTTLSPLGLILVLALTVPLFAGIAIFMRRTFSADARLRMGEALRGQGIVLAEAQSTGDVCAEARAVRRCVLCLSHSRCDEALERKDWQALRRICPNTDYFDAARASP